jgi:hypothetical protein
MFMAVAFSSVCSVDSAYAQCSGSTPVTMTFKNQNPYPVWLGYNAGAGTIAPPLGPGGKGYNLQILANSQTQVCTSSDVASGSFWARTECHFKDFEADPDYVACNTSADCGSSHVCLGGRCLIDCSTPPPSGTGSVNGTNGNCSGLANSVCVAAAKSSAGNYTLGSYCGFSNGVCATGDCGSGQWQCQGSWDNSSEGSGTLTILDGPAPPVSQFELTDAGTNTTYDVSNVAGYNTAVGYTVPTAPPISCQYSPVGCVSDLNTSCPSLLQVTEAPTSTGTGPISCGTGTHCRSGACVSCPTGSENCVSNNTCVIGCTAPSKCANASASSSLQTLCTTQIAGGAGNTFTLNGTTYTADGAEFQDMFGNVNTSGKIGFGNQGATMIDLDGGTFLCWGDKDCPPTDNCLLGSANGIANFPSYVGICVNSSSGEGDQPAPLNCTSSDTPTGQDCGQYNGLGAFTCVAANTTQKDACVPNFDPAIVGFGTFDAPYYTGVGGFPNPEWVYAALVVSGGSQTDPWGTTPFYQTFSEACPYEYQYPYDDKAGSFTCQTDITSAVTVTFGLSGPTTTATPTATATSSATATATATSTSSSTSTLTPTATATATATPTGTSSATPTATPTATATSTATLTPTATATMTASATSSATPTSTPTMTPSPTGTATPNCNLNFDLTTNPPGTLAFGDVSANVPVTLPLTVTNEASLPFPVGTLSLSWKIQNVVKNGGASDFNVTGGSCKKNPKLKNDSSCTYTVRLKAKKSNEGEAVNAQLLISGQFVGKVCPGHKQSVPVTLAGSVVAPGARPHAGR